MTDQIKTVPGETIGRDAREAEIRAAIDKIFEGGCPSSVIILADLTGAGKVRVQCVGPVVDLRGLLLAGATQCASMLDGSERAPKTLNG